MKKRNVMHMAVTGALAAIAAQNAFAGMGFKAGDWDLDFGGNVNGFATWNSCDDKAVGVAGGLACNTGPGGNNKVQSIESGLLPSALVFSGKTRQANLDVGVTLGFYPTLRTNGVGTSNNGALGSSSINVRQNFLTFGDKSWGTIKVGRDIGIFASDAILNDMTLLGVGSGAAFLGGSTTLGRIGVGYIYTDWIPQMSYSSPDYNGFQFAAGIFQGLDIFPFSGHPTSASLNGHDQPGFQGKVSYAWTGSVGGKVWVSAMSQKVKANPGDFAPAGSSVDGTAGDVGVKINVYGFDLLGYYYDANGIGTTAIGLDAAAFVGGTLQKRKSKGGYGQVSYKFGPTKIGYSYGESRLDKASNESNVTSATLVSKNKSHVIGVYYGLTPALSLVAEYIQTKSLPQSGTEIKDGALALGAILFF